MVFSKSWGEGVLGAAITSQEGWDCLKGRKWPELERPHISSSVLPHCRDFSAMVDYSLDL